MKDSDGKKVKIARNIRRVHDAELIRQVQALLQENKLQVPSESTPRHLFHLMPAGNAKEIKGFDPVYENHRRAFASLQELCTEMHKVFISRDDFERVDLMEKVQQGLATSASYLLGHFAYNISPNSKCESHCVNFACSDPKNLNQQENCSAESIDDSEGHSEQCEYCNLFLQAYSLLWKQKKNLMYWRKEDFMFMPTRSKYFATTLAQKGGTIIFKKRRPIECMLIWTLQ